MKRKTILIVVLLSSMLAFGYTPALQAQQAGAPLIVNTAGDLWSWSGPGAKLKQLTTWGYNNAPVLSPDGKQVAYSSYATIYVNVIKKSGGMSGADFPMNIWLLDVATNEGTRLADQPAGAYFNAPGDHDQPDRYITRSDPVWSPDGKAIAWSEFNYVSIRGQEPTEETYRLAVYDLAQASVKIIVPKFPLQAGVSSVVPVEWGKPGLAVISWPRDRDDMDVLVYSPKGKLVSSTTLSDAMNMLWIENDGQDLIAVLTHGPKDAPSQISRWMLIDPATGQVSDMPGVPELYSLGAPDGISVYAVDADTNAQWQIVVPGKPAITLDGLFIDNLLTLSGVAISPDGQQIAYLKDDKVSVYHDGKITTIDVPDVPGLVNGLAWGPVAWRVRPNGAN